MGMEALGRFIGKYGAKMKGLAHGVGDNIVKEGIPLYAALALNERTKGTDHMVVDHPQHADEGSDEPGGDYDELLSKLKKKKKSKEA